jgi:hypothetical protein
LRKQPTFMAKAPEPRGLIRANWPTSTGPSIFRLLPAALASIAAHVLLVGLLVFVVEAPGNDRPQLERVERNRESRTVRAADVDRSRPDMRTPIAPDFSAKDLSPPANFKAPVKAEFSIPEVADPLKQPGLKNGEKEKELADVPKGFGFKVKDTGPALPELPGLEGPAGTGLPMGLDPASIEKYAGGPFGRSGAQRDEALSDFGGDNESEVAVNRGLDFLKRTQQANGSWKVVHESFPVEERNKVTVRTLSDDLPPTSLALLAFLSRGCTEEDKISNGRGGLIDNPYADVVKKAVRYLGDQVNNKLSAMAQASKLETYELYGVATLALCELYIMTRDEARRDNLKVLIGNALRVLKERQGTDGGWTHQNLEKNAAKADGHMVPTGWAIQALRTAQMAGLIKADDPALDKARLFVESLADPATQGFRDTRASLPKAVPSVVGLLNRMHTGGVAANFSSLAAGVDHFVFKLGADYKQPTWSVDDNERHKVFYWFYGTQAMFHLGGDHWKAWNLWMRTYFLREQKQVTDDKKLAGSWEPVDAGDTTELIGGRMLRTCLAILTLEVYYRQVPLHLRDLASR